MGGSFDGDFKNSGNSGNLENNIILNGDNIILNRKTKWKQS